MSQYLYTDGSEKKPTYLELLIRFILISLVGCLLIGLFFALSKLIPSEFPFISNLLLGVYGIPVIFFCIYIFLKTSLPMVAITSKYLKTYKGVLFRDKFLLSEVRKIETELNDDNGIQLIVYLNYGGKFTAEIPINSCSDGQFAGFMQKYAPQIEVLTQHKILHDAENGNTGLQLVSTNDDVGEVEIDELWEKYIDFVNKEEYEKSLSILRALETKGEAVAGLIGEFYLSDDIVSKDYEKAYQYFQQGELVGCKISILKIGIMYFHGFHLEQSYKKAFNYFYSIKGYKDGQLNYYLGHCYLRRPVELSDQDLAKRCFLKAVAMGYDLGYEGLAILARRKKKVCTAFNLARRAY